MSYRKSDGTMAVHSSHHVQRQLREAFELRVERPEKAKLLVEKIERARPRTLRATAAAAADRA